MQDFSLMFYDKYDLYFEQLMKYQPKLLDLWTLLDSCYSSSTKL